MRLDRVPFHPILFAAYPVLYLLAENLQDAEVGEAAMPLLFVVSSAAAVWALLRLVLNDWRKAAVATSILVLLFFSYGYVYEALDEGSLSGIGRHRTLMPLWGLLAAGGVVLAARAKRWLPRATTTLNFTAIVLVVLNVISIVSYRLRGADPTIVPGHSITSSPLPDGARSGRRPDVYYLIFDRYGRRDVLQQELGFDNGPFVDFLEDHGFFVADRSNANYARTVFSVASAVSMDHLDGLRRSVGPGSSDLAPLREAIRGNVAARYMKRLGYRFINLGSWWGPTSRTPLADGNLRPTGLSEFSSVLYKTTMLAPLAETFSSTVVRRRDWRRVRLQFDTLEQTTRIPGPKFVFAHVLSPHAPFVIDRHGRYVTLEQSRARARGGSGRNYIEQLLYVNSRLTKLVEELQELPQQPVIILQSDEGPGATPESFERVDAEKVRRKMSIFNAYYLPGVEDPQLYPTITPVNSFRAVFNAYFDAGFPMLPDRSYVYTSLEDLYTFKDVTRHLTGDG